MRSDWPFSNNVNFSHEPAEVAEVTPKSCSVGRVGLRGAEVGQGG